MRNLLLTLTAIIGLITSTFSQELASMAYSTPLQLNPSLAGYAGVSRVLASYMAVSPTSRESTEEYNLSYDGYVRSWDIGLGLHFAHENEQSILYAGSFAHQNIGLVASKQLIMLRNMTLIIGAEVSYYQREFDKPNITLGQGTVQEVERASGLTVAPGALLTSDNWIAGFSVKDINQPDISVLQQESRITPRTYSAHIAYQFFNVQDKFRMSPDIIYYSHSGSNTLLWGTHFKYNWAKMGARFRQIFLTTDDVFYYAGYVGNRWSVNLSYGSNINRLSSREIRNTSEISVSFSFLNRSIQEMPRLPEIIAF